MNKETIIKIQEGDIFSIPTENNLYGLGQILRINHPKRKSNMFAVLFNVLYRQDELKGINQDNIEKLDILSAMPIDLYSIRSRSPKKWKIIKNLSKISYPVPMFNLYSPAVTQEESLEEAIILVDFGYSYYRNIGYKESMKNPNYFIRSSGYFENLLIINFFDPSHINNFIEGYIYKWEDDYISEKDMIVNKDKYEKWMGWASSWKDL